MSIGKPFYFVCALRMNQEPGQNPARVSTYKFDVHACSPRVSEANSKATIYPDAVDSFRAVARAIGYLISLGHKPEEITVDHIPDTYDDTPRLVKVEK